MRLIGESKLGFYPTPKSVVNDIIRILDLKPKTRILDPCCGEGAALRDIKLAFPGVDTYGVELNAIRYEKAKAIIDQCLHCDALNELITTKECFDVLWENPPYDNDILNDNEKSVRLESKFLRLHAKYLKKEGGILIYIIPFRSLSKVKNLLIKYTDLKVLAFPKEEYEAFKQIVVFGKSSKKLNEATISRNMDYLNNIIAEIDPEKAYEYLETTSETVVIYRTEPCGVEVKDFYTSRINPNEAVQLIKTAGINRIFCEFTKVKGIASIRPLAELTEGHLAMLIAAGMMDGLLETDTERMVVKGFVNEQFNEREEFNGDRELLIKRKQYKITVNAINLTSNTFMEVIA